MSTHAFDGRSVVLRLEFSIADAVHQRGLFPVLGAALAAWWQRPPRLSQVPQSLRADLGLPPLNETAHWHTGSLSPPDPERLRWIR
ncbi:hypothetical protein IC608_08840 [Devosia sp. PTR5]|uniref:Uncharacterized protein n=1 Tax=Devosia oryzisoli TaxID=2774138 RepID=A0A927ITD3_9HYPH|nr:hypothetical protein [Devosia oryzisoli]MBD8065581.1 hypothetical protein [Devosia oryzisoli]